jgi:hypothetical protein
MRAEVRSAVGAWLPVDLLVDVGADRTVFSAGVLQALGFGAAPAGEELEGVGGRTVSVVFASEIRALRETGAWVSFAGQFSAVSDPQSLDMSVLGRDITNLFGVLVDRPQDLVCLVGAKHRCVIVET